MSRTPPPRYDEPNDDDQSAEKPIPAHEQFAEAVVDWVYLFEVVFWGGLNALIVLACIAVAVYGIFR